MKIIKKWFRGGSPFYMIYGELNVDKNGINQDLAERIKEIRYDSIAEIPLNFNKDFEEWRRSLHINYERERTEKVASIKEIEDRQIYNAERIMSKFLTLN